MTSGVINLSRAGVPPDAPAPEPGETPWISGQQVPVQVGVYRRLSISGTTQFSYFDGAHWLWNKRSADLAARVPSTEPSLIQTLPWCGLVTPPPQGYGPLPTEPAAEGAAHA